MYMYMYIYIYIHIFIYVSQNRLKGRWARDFRGSIKYDCEIYMLAINVINNI